MTNAWMLVADEAGVDHLVEFGEAAGCELTALVVGERAMAESVAKSGVAKVQWMERELDVPSEAYASAVAAAVSEAAPALVLASTRPSDRVLAGAVAARLGAPVYTMASSATTCTNGLEVTRFCFGGIAQETICAAGPVVLLCEGGSVHDTGKQAPIVELPCQDASGLTVIETAKATIAPVDLSRAKRIVAVGRGLKRREDLDMVEALARALQAEVACSRPMAEGMDWLTHDRYIGVTGQHVAPELYIAIGISGQLQHVVGMRESGLVVAINSDDKAPFFAEVDYGITGDLYQVVPALTKVLS